MSDNQKLNIWGLIHLEQELDIIASKLDSVAIQHDLAVVDPGLLMTLLRQINRCHGHIKSAVRYEKG
jgi:hypothetical protein